MSRRVIRDQIGEWTPEAIAIMKRMNGEGYQDGDIAAVLGRTARAVQKKRSGYKLPSNAARGPSVVPKLTEQTQQAVRVRSGLACQRHLADLIKEHGDMNGGCVVEIIALSQVAYRAKFELEIAPGYRPVPQSFNVYSSGCGSAAALCLVG